LTSAGEALAQQCGTLLCGYRSALEYLEALVQGDAGVLSVASSNTVAAYVLPHWLIEYRRSYNGVRIAARSTNSELVVAALHDGEVEIGLVEMPELNPGRGFVAHPIGGDELVLVCSPKLAQFPTREVDWDEIRKLPLVTREYGSGVRAVVERALSAARYRPEQVIELAGGEAVREAILAGLGIGFLSSLAVVRDIAEGLLVPLTLRGLGHLERGFRVFSKPFDELSIPARNFLTLVTR
ncbi:MAG: LysR substrate-binding domain-containing protein, partial [Acidimicrobiales bacterium]